MKVLVTILLQLEILPALLPLIFRFAFGRYTRPSAFKVAPGPQLSSTPFVSAGSWYNATPCHGLAGSIEGDNESVDACPFPLGKLTALGAELSPVKTMVVLSALMAELFANQASVFDDDDRVRARGASGQETTA